MKPASGGLIALLNSATVLLMADLYTLTTRSGTFRWTQADTNLVLGGNTFLCAQDQGGQPLIKRGGIRFTRGMEVPVLELDLFQGQTVQLLGIPLTMAAQNGALDGARLKVERVVMPTWGDTSLGSSIEFEGNVAGLDISSTKVRLHVKGDLEKLSQMMPRTLFMPGCANSFGDANCGKDLVALTVSGTATGTPTTTVIPSGRGEAASYFNLGVLAMTSGPSAGSRRSISGFNSGTFTLAIPLPSTPGAGDTFTAYPGCARTFAACGVWTNQSAFRGAPFVPVPETAR